VPKRAAHGLRRIRTGSTAAHRREEFLSMPFPLIPTALGVCFVLMWALVAGIIIHDGQISVRQENGADAGR
jgi:hypothetical protein